MDRGRDLESGMEQQGFKRGVIGENQRLFCIKILRLHLLVLMQPNYKHSQTTKGWTPTSLYGKEDLYNSPSHKSDKCNGSELRFRPSQTVSSKACKSHFGSLLDVPDPHSFQTLLPNRKVRTPTEKINSFKVSQAPSAKELPDLKYFRSARHNDYAQPNVKHPQQPRGSEPISQYFTSDASSTLSIDFRNSGEPEQDRLDHHNIQKTERMPRGSHYWPEDHTHNTHFDHLADKSTPSSRLKQGKPNEDLFKKPTYNLKQTTSTHSTIKLTHKRSEQTLPKAVKFKEPSNPFGNKLRISDFRIQKCMGKGKFGSVYMVRHILTGFLAALKIISKRQVVQENLLTQLIRQIKIHAYLNHPNIIEFYGFFEDKDNVYILLELGSDGQLYTKLKHKQTYSQEATSFIIKSLLEAVQHMHNRRILHRDIKPENIVIVHGTVKLCDFGWAVDRGLGNDLRTTMCGTPLYSSPEILMGRPYGEHNDLWAVGILAYELIMGYIPFDITQQEELIKIITDQIQFPKDIELSEDYKDFVTKILQKNPKNRIKCQELLRHPFIEQYRELETCEELCSNH